MRVADRRAIRGDEWWIGRISDHPFSAERWRDEFLWLPLKDRGLLPTEPGVYIAVTYDDIPIYVGMSSTSLRQRWAGHHRLQAIERLGGDRLAFFTCDDPDAHYLYGAELHAMRTLQPILNDRSDAEVGVEFFEGRRRLIPLTETDGVGWKTRWKSKPRRPRPPAE